MNLPSPHSAPPPAESPLLKKALASLRHGAVLMALLGTVLLVAPALYLVNAAHHHKSDHEKLDAVVVAVEDGYTERHVRVSLPGDTEDVVASDDAQPGQDIKIWRDRTTRDLTLKEPKIEWWEWLIAVGMGALGAFMIYGLGDARNSMERLRHASMQTARGSVWIHTTHQRNVSTNGTLTKVELTGEVLQSTMAHTTPGMVLYLSGNPNQMPLQELAGPLEIWHLSDEMVGDVIVHAAGSPAWWYAQRSQFATSSWRRQLPGPLWGAGQFLVLGAGRACSPASE